jgi:hypothetical protein
MRERGAKMKRKKSVLEKLNAKEIKEITSTAEKKKCYFDQITASEYAPR